MRIGTIGTGIILRWVLDGFRDAENVSVEAVYSRSEEKGRKLAGEYGAAKVYTDLTEMLRDDRVEFVYVASPNDLHYPQARLALEHGKHVICEKPFTVTAAQTAELIRLAQEKQLLLIEAVPPTFLPNFRLTRELLPKIGRIRLVMSNYSQYSSRYDNLLQGEVTNIFSREHAGGCLMDIGVYNLYFNIALFGKPEEAVYTPNLYPGLVDTSGVLTLRYPDFVSSNVCAKDTWGENYVQIQGEKGYLYITGGPNGWLQIKLVTKDTEEIHNLQQPISRYWYQGQEIARIAAEQDYAECRRRLEISQAVMDVLEQARKDAGIVFGEA